MYCAGRKEATVIYSSTSGKTIKFITHHVPIEVECSNEESSGRFIFTLEDYGYVGSCGSSGQIFVETIIADSYQVSLTTNPGVYSHCPWYEISFFIDEKKTSSFKKTFRYSISQISNPNYKKGKFLTIKDISGKVIFQTEVKICNQQITCDDDCPEGSHKCTHKAYPGYCCLPCKETGQRINNIANKIR